MGMYHEYAKSKTRDKALKEFPGLSKAELETANGFFTPYLFFENVEGGRRVWTSCCYHDGELWEKLPRTETPQNRAVMALNHNDECECPYCHKKVTAKNVKKVGKGKRLEEYVPILFLHTSKDGGTIYAQGYWAWKGYADKERMAQPPLYKVTRVFRFRRGEWLAWEHRWIGGEKYGMVIEGRKWIGEPFTSGEGMMVSYCQYRVIGLDRLAESFLRYTGIMDLYAGEPWCERLISRLALAAQYPEGVEMLTKAGLTEPIEDWVWGRKKNAKAIKWDEKDPRKVFDLNSRELKEFLASKRELDVLVAYKDLRKGDKKVTIREVEKAKMRLGEYLLVDIVKELRRTPTTTLRKLIQYLERMEGPRCGGRGVMTIRNAAEMWRDYIKFARELKYNLKNPIIFTPKNLDLKHTEAYQAVVAIHEEERREEEKKRRDQAKKEAKKKDEGVRGRVETLSKRYGFETEHYLIRPPVSAVEIVEEGQALLHCVGGYAGRHADGTATILFLRSKERPDTPLCTIEMRGSSIVQIHGYKNDMGQQVTPRKKYREILDPWLAWVEAGSKRTKDGRPKLPKEKKEVKAA